MTLALVFTLFGSPPPLGLSPPPPGFAAAFVAAALVTTWRRTTNRNARTIDVGIIADAPDGRPLRLMSILMAGPSFLVRWLLFQFRPSPAMTVVLAGCAVRPDSVGDRKYVPFGLGSTQTDVPKQGCSRLAGAAESKRTDKLGVDVKTVVLRDRHRNAGAVRDVVAKSERQFGAWRRVRIGGRPVPGVSNVPSGLSSMAGCIDVEEPSAHGMFEPAMTAPTFAAMVQPLLQKTRCIEDKPRITADLSCAQTGINLRSGNQHRRTVHFA